MCKSILGIIPVPVSGRFPYNYAVMYRTIYRLGIITTLVSAYMWCCVDEKATISRLKNGHFSLLLIVTLFQFLHYTKSPLVEFHSTDQTKDNIACIIWYFHQDTNS
jgi:hypothetical protein